MSKIEQNIPEGWSVKKLGDIGLFSKGTGIVKNDLVEQGLPCVRYAELYTKYDFVIKKCFSFISRDIAKTSKQIFYGDILFAGSGETREDIGKCATYIAEESAFAGGDNIIFSPTKEINSIFLSYYLNTKGRKQLNRFGQGDSIVHIHASNLVKVIVLLPPILEQEKIAGVLSVWDEGIEKLSALIGWKEKQKKSLMQKLLKCKSGWQFIRFDNIFKDYCKKNCLEERLLSATQDRGVIPRDMLEGRVMSPEGSVSGYKLINEGDFVISLRSFQGGLEYSKYRGILSPAYTVLRNVIEINKDFYRYFFKSYVFIEKYLYIAVIGIRDGKQISYPDLCSVKIPYPSLVEQKAIAEELSTADDEISLLKQKLSVFKEQKKALMQQLLIGKIRVKIN